MIVKRIFNRRTFVIFFLAVLLFELFTPIISRAATSSDTVLSYDQSPIESDLANMDLVDYPYNKNGKCEIIGLMEYCYSENSLYSSVYGLYIYVYNPTAKALSIETGDNQISLSQSFDSSGDASNFSNEALVYLDHTSDNLFYKFKIADNLEQYDIAKDYASRFNGKRRYEIGSLDVMFNRESKRETFKVSTVYEWSGYAAWCGDPAISISSLSCEFSGDESIHLVVNDTNYRFEYKSDYLCDDLQSVYFSIPNSYYDEFGLLSKIEAEWYQYKTKPIFVTSDSDTKKSDYDEFNSLFEMIGKPINENGEYVNNRGEIEQTLWRVLWEEDYLDGHYGFSKGYNAYADNIWETSAKIYYLKDDFSALDCFFWFFLRNGVEDRDDYDVSSYEIKEYIEWYKVNFGGDSYLNYRYPLELFESSDDAYRTKTFTIDGEQVYLDSKKDQSWFTKFWFGVNIDEFSCSPIVTISEYDLKMEDDEFSEYYLVNEDDVSEIKEFARDSIEKGETPVLLRFALSDYYSANARFDYADGNSFNFSSIDGYVAQETVYLDFDILSLTFQKDAETETTIPVVAESIDIINGLTAPKDIPIEEEEWWQKIIALLLVLVLLKLLSFFIGPLKIVFEIVSRGAKVLISFVLYVLKLPFKLLFLPFRRR